VRAGGSAARRRRNVLATILLANIVVLALAAFGVVAWGYAAIPGTLLVAWLVACRLMVKRERSVRVPVSRVPVATPEPTVAATAGEPEDLDGADPSADTSTMAVTMPAATAAAVDPTLWDPVPVTLPTYVTKPAATRRTVRTIDLDDTGVWTSGRSESDSRIARDAEQAERADKAARKQAGDDRAVGS
ncbi:MAG: hypothetical protein JWO76_1405, partial [Nocardioides sp.]|nr:hypothetical protein [Nocardioides sp.]